MTFQVGAVIEISHASNQYRERKICTCLPLISELQYSEWSDEFKCEIIQFQNKIPKWQERASAHLGLLGGGAAQCGKNLPQCPQWCHLGCWRAELHTVSEGTVKVWDLTNQYLKLNIKTSSKVNSTLTRSCSTEVSPQVGSSAGIWPTRSCSRAWRLISVWSLPSPITSCDDLKGVYCEDAVCVVLYLTSHIKVCSCLDLWRAWTTTWRWS